MGKEEVKAVRVGKKTKNSNGHFFLFSWQKNARETFFFLPCSLSRQADANGALLRRPWPEVPGEDLPQDG